MGDDGAVLASNLVLFAAAERALRALAARGVRVAPIKGAWLVERGLRDARERSMCDVDLVVDWEKRPAAHAAMLATGFARLHERPNRPYTDRVSCEWSYELRLGGGEVHLELHFAIAPVGWLRVTTRELLDRAVAGSFGGVPCLQLADEDNVCIVLYHLGHHGFTAGREAYIDLVKLRRAGLLDDIRSVLERCRRWGCGTIAWTALDVMNVAFPEVAVELPVEFRPSLASRVYLGHALRRGAFPACAVRAESLYGRFVHRWFLMDGADQRVCLLTDVPYRVAHDVVELGGGRSATNSP